MMALIFGQKIGIGKSKYSPINIANLFVYRLREIAKGNPDETKIGAFGVGFYSVFAVTNEPMVHSGETAMSFYYVGDQLNYKRLQLQSSGKWTTVDLPYSVPKPIPNLSDFTSFFAQSLTFVKLHRMELFVDGILFLSISKTKSDPINLAIPREINVKSSEGLMKMTSVETEAVQIKVNYLNATQLGKADSEVKGFMAFGFRLMQTFTTDSEKPSDYSEAILFLR